MKTMETTVLWIACLMLVLCCALAAPAGAEQPVVERLMDYDPAALFDVVNGSVEAAKVDGASVLRWHVNAGQTSVLSMRRDHPLFDRLRSYEVLDFEFRVAGGEVNGIDVDLLGQVTGTRRYKVHEWHTAVRTTERNVWHRRFLELTRPNWLPWDNPDGEGDSYFRFEALGLVPGTVVELRNVCLTRPPLLLKPDFEYPITWPVPAWTEAGDAVYTMKHRVLNASGRPATLRARVLSKHDRFQVTVLAPGAPEAAGRPVAEAQLKSGATADFTVRAVMKAADVKAARELYEETIRLSFEVADRPEAPWYWEGAIVRPLSAGLRQQVIVPKEELAKIRDGLKAGDAEMKRLIGYDRVLTGADEFLAKKLLHIPASNEHPGSFWVDDWRPGDFMPEAVNTKTGERQMGTQIASITWKKYFGYPGFACDNLGLAYLYTGDEKYARKAIELFKLYAAQYGELHWGPMLGAAPWDNPGTPTLSSSRVAVSSTYGTNMNFKWHCRLLSLVADSPSWTDEDRRDVYLGFVLPYATELMKFPGGISNMTDITNHNVLLLGIVFGDANLVRWAMLSDPGIVRRLGDIDNDGFTSEGRPLNYQFAAMTEFLPSVGYLVRSGLPVEFPKQKLLAALRMPYYRADLTGVVPSTGDCGRGQRVGRNALAAELIPIFPDQDWLYDAGATPLQLHMAARKLDPEGWRRLIAAGPRLFGEAGMAILRSGDAADSQVMVTLDYGRNVFHAGLDRNQVTLNAFGKVLTHGPGSLYNAGSGGIRPAEDARLRSFITHGSLSYNVVLVDMENQLPAVGRLLAWSDGPDLQTAVACVDGVRPGVRHTRGVVLSRGVVVMLDRLESDAEHVYDFVYHNFGALSPGQGWAARPLQQPLGRTANYENIVDPKRLYDQGPVRLDWDLSRQVHYDVQEARDKKGEPFTPVHLALWQRQVKGGEVYIGTTGLNNPNTGYVPDGAPSLLHRVRARSVQFVTVLEPYKDKRRVTAIEPAGEDGVTIQIEGAPALTVGLDELVRRYAVR